MAEQSGRAREDDANDEAAFAAGENAGPKTMMAASKVPRKRRWGPLFFTALDSARNDDITLRGKS